MPSTFLGLNTAGTGLNYFQSALNTTAHNVANQKTEGYSRQQVISKAADAIRVSNSYGMQGTGVSVSGIEQVREEYYDIKYRNAMSTFQEYETKNTYLLELETYSNEMNTSSGYTKLFSNISSAMSSLISDPSGSTTRTQFTQSLDNMTDYINELSSNYQETQQSANTQISLYVDEVNSLGKQIYTLSEQILNIEVRGGNASDLRDQRALAVDNLSEIVNVSVEESSMTYGTGKDAVDSGGSTFIVRINNQVLVDSAGSNRLQVVPREEKVNQNDIDGIYDVYWEGKDGTIGDDFNLNDSSCEGKLKGLYEIRDGNNANPISGTISAITNGATIHNATMTLSKSISINELTLSDSGTVTFNGKECYYDGWDAVCDAEGNITKVTFNNLTIRDSSGNIVVASLDDDISDGYSDLTKAASVGESVNFKGIPYYMERLNQFVRTFSDYMNDIATYTKTDISTGLVTDYAADANGDAGLDVFTTLDTTGADYVLKGTGTGPTLSNTQASYYRLTALNWSVNSAVLKDSNKVVTALSSDVMQGNKDANSVIKKMYDGLTDKKMFTLGTASQFIDTLTTSIAVDATKSKNFATNQEDISNVIDTQRKSVSSVDQNEEANNLVSLQKGYDLACKLIQVLNEVYDKLINGTGI